MKYLEILNSIVSFICQCLQLSNIHIIANEILQTSFNKMKNKFQWPSSHWNSYEILHLVFIGIPDLQ